MKPRTVYLRTAYHFLHLSLIFVIMLSFPIRRQDSLSSVMFLHHTILIMTPFRVTLLCIVSYTFQCMQSLTDILLNLILRCTILIHLG
jgi:hypothetical protein